MSCNIYEEPRFNLAERRQADGGERLEQPVEIYESANGLDIHLGHVARRKGGRYPHIHMYTHTQTASSFLALCGQFFNNLKESFKIINIKTNVIIF